MEKSLISVLVLVLAWTPRGRSAADQVPDFCNLFPDDGTGLNCLMYLPQFFYNSTSQVCEEFIYSGCGGNDNRFSSKKTCTETCSRHPVLTREVGPLSFGDNDCASPRTHPRKDRRKEQDACNQPAESGPCLGYFPQYFYDPNHNKCHIFIYGGCGGNDNRFDSLNSCLKQCEVPPALNATEVCSLPPETGPCRAAFPSLFYNPQSQRCEPFTYGGCAGNANRFESIKDCMRLCHPEGSDAIIPLVRSIPDLQEKPSACDLPPETGRCRANIPRYFYNSTSQQCETFTYGGCGGNENNFVSKRKCNVVCSHEDQEETETTETEPVDICLLPPKTGRCKAHIPRYYYNHKTQKCEEFVYGGCKGNKNNFVNAKECMKACQKG